MKLWKKLWGTSRRRLIIISVLALCMYCLTTAIVANCLIEDYCSFNIFQDETILPYNEDQEANQSLYESYIANFYDTSIFFIIVTLAIGIFGFIKPEDEVFERKLVYLFPDLHRSDEGKKYVTNKINKMAAISPFSRHTISFDEFIQLDSDNTLFKCGSIYEAEISNLHGSNSYKDNNVEIKFALKQIEIDEVQDATNDFKWGQLTMLRTHFDKDLSDPMPWHNGKKRNFIDKSHRYSIKDLEIPAKESVHIDVNSWSWSKFNKEKYDAVSVQRFTESIKLFFINNLEDRKLKVSYFVAKKTDNFELLMNSDGDFEHGEVLDFSNTEKNRFHKEIKYFTPDQIILWKVRAL